MIIAESFVVAAVKTKVAICLLKIANYCCVNLVHVCYDS